MQKLVIGIVATAIIMFAGTRSLSAQTADEIIQKHIAAMGGKEKLMTLKSVKKTGTLTVQGFEVGITITVLNGVGFRSDIAVPGMDPGFIITTPAKGWSFMPYRGQAAPEEVPADQVKSSQHLLDLQGLLLNYQEKGSTVELAGKDKVGNAVCYKLKLTDKSGMVFNICIDTSTAYIVKLANKAHTENGEEDVETIYSDFKKNDDGFIFPFSQTTPRGPITFSLIEANKPVDDKFFTVN